MMISKPRTLRFNTIDEAIAEVARLRRGYVPHGAWTLPQVLWHVSAIAATTLDPAAPGATATPEEAARKVGFVDAIVKTWRGEPGAAFTPPKDAPPPYVPPAETSHDAIDLFDQTFAKLRDATHPVAATHFFGPVPIEEVRILHLFHLAHHLSYLEPRPATRRVGLSFANEDEIIADVNRLRRGYAETGNWNLWQIAWHLEATTRMRLDPTERPAATDEQRARRPLFDQVLAEGKLPDALPLPDALRPPPAFQANPVEALLATLERFKAYTGEFGNHRLFGPLTREEGLRINRIHCAHHLSYLVPVPAKN